eukprot:162504_1
MADSDELKKQMEYATNSNETQMTQISQPENDDTSNINHPHQTQSEEWSKSYSIKFDLYENEIDEKKQEKEQNQEKDNIISEKDNIISEKNNIISENDNTDTPQKELEHHGDIKEQDNTDTQKDELILEQSYDKQLKEETKQNDKDEMEQKYNDSLNKPQNIYLLPYEGYMFNFVHETPLTNIIHPHEISPINGYQIKQLYKKGESTFGLNITITKDNGNRFYFEMEGSGYCGYAKSSADSSLFLGNTSIYAWNRRAKSHGNDEKNPYPNTKNKAGAISDVKEEQSELENEKLEHKEQKDDHESVHLPVITIITDETKEEQSEVVNEKVEHEEQKQKEDHESVKLPRITDEKRVGCLLDLNKGTINYYIDGIDLGIAFDNIVLSEDEYIYPIFSGGSQIVIAYKKEDIKYLPNDSNYIHVDKLLRKSVSTIRSQKKMLILEPIKLTKSKYNQISKNTTGKWAFEVEYKFSNIGRDFDVGWILSSAKDALDQNNTKTIGDVSGSWIVNPLTGVKRTDNKSYLHTIPISGAQKIECFVDIENGEISYRKSRDEERIAFTNLKFESSVIYPAISFHSGACPTVKYDRVANDKLEEGFLPIRNAPWYSYGMYSKTQVNDNVNNVLLKNFAFSNIVSVHEGYLVDTNMGYCSVISQNISKDKIYFEARTIGGICRDFTINLLLETFMDKTKEIKMSCSINSDIQLSKNDILQILIDTKSQNAMIMIKLNKEECSKCVQPNPFIEVDLSSIYISISASIEKDQKLLFVFDEDSFEYKVPAHFSVMTQSNQGNNKLSELVLNALESNTKTELIRLYLKIMYERITNVSADITLLQTSLKLIEENCENNVLTELIKTVIQEWSAGDMLEKREKSNFPVKEQLSRMIQSFINKSVNPLSSAIQMARFINKYSVYFPDIADELHLLAVVCEKHAVHIIQSMQSNRLKIIYLETDGTLSLAIKHDLKEFISSSCLQTLRYAIWISDPVQLLCKPDIDLMAKAEGELITWIKIMLRDFFQNVNNFDDLKNIYGSIKLQHQYFYSPIGRMQIEFFIYLAFLLLIFSVAISSRTVWSENIATIEYVFWVANASFIFSEIIQISSSKYYWKDVNNYLDMIMCSTMIILFILRLLALTDYIDCDMDQELEDTDCENKSLNVFYINIWFVLILCGCARLIYLSFVFQSMGLLINNIIQITFKILNLIAFTAILTFGFGIAIYVAVGDELTDYSSPTTSARTIIFGLVETLDWQVFTQISGENDFGYWRSTTLQFWIFVFVIFSAVILLNLIIAIMTTTFDEVNSNAVDDVNFHRFRVCYQKSIELAVLPPPFQFAVVLFSYLITIVFKIFGILLDVSWTICYQHKHYKDYKEMVRVEQIRQKKLKQIHTANNSRTTTHVNVDETAALLGETDTTHAENQQVPISKNSEQNKNSGSWICTYCCAKNFNLLHNADLQNMNRQTQGFAFVKTDLEALTHTLPILCANCFRNKNVAKREMVLASSISFYIYAIISWICRIPFCILLIIYLPLKHLCVKKTLFFRKSGSWMTKIDPSNNMGYDLKLTNPKVILEKDFEAIANSDEILKQKLVECVKTNESINILKNVPYNVAASFKIWKQREKESFNYIAEAKPKIILHGTDIDFDFDGSGVTTAYQKRK